MPEQKNQWINGYESFGPKIGECGSSGMPYEGNCIDGTGIYKKILEFVKIVFYLKEDDIFKPNVALLWHLRPREGFILPADMI